MRHFLCTATCFLILLLSCSKSGYVEVENRSGATIEEVTVGGKISLGNIADGAHKAVETEHLGTFHVEFKQNEKSYRSKGTVTIDAETSATFTYRDSSDVTVVE